MGRPGFRRRILIEPGVGVVRAELEDDWHRMVVSLSHRDGVVVGVESDMKRWPWTTCPGAIATLTETFTGVALADVARRGERAQNCTHLHDLTLFAAAHAEEAASTAYDVEVEDAVGGRRVARLVRNDQLMLDWHLEGDLFLSPDALAGRRLGDLGDWLAGLESDVREAARILRWAAIMAYGRTLDMPAGVSATVFPAGACFTFQPTMASAAVRRPDVPRDLSLPGAQPLADRASMFGSSPPRHDRSR